MTERTGGRVIAVEEHFATERYWQRTAGWAAPAGEEDELRFVRSFIDNPRIHRRLADLPTRVQEMDDNGIDLSVLSLNPPGVQLWADAADATAVAIEANDALAELVSRHPTRFAGLAAVAPQDPIAAATGIVRAVEVLHLNGVLIGSHTAGHYLDELAYEPILSALEQTGAPLYLHPRMPSPGMKGPFDRYGLQLAVWGYQAEASVHAVRLIMSGALDRHPGLRVVLGHLGEGLPFWLWRLDNLAVKYNDWAHELLQMADLELRPSEYFRRNFVITTSGMCDPDVLDYCLTKVGADHILFAVDYPYEETAVATGFLAAADLDDEQRALISHGNAERIFGISPS